MTDQMHDRPMAAAGLTSYRYLGRYGYIMIGALDHEHAMREARRSTDDAIERENLEVWNGQAYEYAFPIMVPQPVQQQQARAGYAPLFDDADLTELARQMPVEPAWIEYQRQAARRAEKVAASFDIASRMIHDRQFLDLSERYDPTEPTDDELQDAADRDRLFIVLGTCAVIVMQACFAGYLLASLIL